MTKQQLNILANKLYANGSICLESIEQRDELQAHMNQNDNVILWDSPCRDGVIVNLVQTK